MYTKRVFRPIYIYIYMCCFIEIKLINIAWTCFTKDEHQKKTWRLQIENGQSIASIGIVLASTRSNLVKMKMIKIKDKCPQGPCLVNLCLYLYHISASKADPVAHQQKGSSALSGQFWNIRFKNNLELQQEPPLIQLAVQLCSWQLCNVQLAVQWEKPSLL